MEPIKVQYWYEYIEEHPDFTGCLIDSVNDIAWFKNGKEHSEDGHPAIECANGFKAWYKNGKRHRDDGPAIIWSDGNKEWYKNGKKHREDGPAIERANGYKAWYLKGVQYNEQDYKIAIRKIKLEKVLKKINR